MVENANALRQGYAEPRFILDALFHLRFGSPPMSAKLFQTLSLLWEATTALDVLQNSKVEQFRLQVQPVSSGRHLHLREILERKVDDT